MNNSIFDIFRIDHLGKRLFSKIIFTFGLLVGISVYFYPLGDPDFSALLSYGNEAVMLEKLMTETEKEMQTIREAATEKDLQKLDSLTHHLRSSWEVLRADQPLNVLYGLLHGDTLPDGEALSRAVTAVLEKGAEIIRLAEEERRKYEDG